MNPPNENRFNTTTFINPVLHPVFIPIGTTVGAPNPGQGSPHIRGLPPRIFNVGPYALRGYWYAAYGAPFIAVPAALLGAQPNDHANPIAGQGHANPACPVPWWNPPLASTHHPQTHHPNVDEAHSGANTGQPYETSANPNHESGGGEMDHDSEGDLPAEQEHDSVEGNEWVEDEVDAHGQAHEADSAGTATYSDADPSAAAETVPDSQVRPDLGARLCQPYETNAEKSNYESNAGWNTAGSGYNQRGHGPIAEFGAVPYPKAPMNGVHAGRAGGPIISQNGVPNLPTALERFGSIDEPAQPVHRDVGRLPAPQNRVPTCEAYRQSTHHVEAARGSTTIAPRANLFPYSLGDLALYERRIASRPELKRDQSPHRIAEADRKRGRWANEYPQDG
ncbi:hypothetical protein KEM54_000940 [Ascosphaera aggregata]|nr:hypothetical protein KEM54_000940 [Ascosphaera aggregata]